MLKKVMIGSAIAAGTVGLLVGAPAFNYLKSGVSSARQAIKDAIPIEVEIKRARDMITDLKPEISDNLRVIAREEVEVKRLGEEVESKKQLLAKARKDIMRLKDDLQSGGSHFVYASRTFTAGQVKDDLSARFKQFQTHEATLAKLEKILEARSKNLDAARRKLDEMLAAKRQLEVEVENLQARLTMVQVAETASQVAVNDSHLSRTRDLLNEIRSRIDVAEKMVDQVGVMTTGSIPLEEDAPADLIDMITDYFGPGRSEVESLVKN